MACPNGHWGEEGVGWWWDTYDNLLVTVIPEAVASMSHLEQEWDTEKLEMKLREYFIKSAKKIEYVGKGMEKCINEYADNVMTSLFAGLGDREWLVTGQVDFLVVFDAAVKDLFPGKKMRYVTQTDFETWCLMAYSRAFDEQRIYPLLQDAVPTVVSGPKLKKKVWAAVDEGRKQAVRMWPPNAEDFTKEWITTAVKMITDESMGHPSNTLEPEKCVQLFMGLLQSNALPMTYKEHQVPLECVGPHVTEAYTQYTLPEGAEPLPSKRMREKWGIEDGDDFDQLFTKCATGQDLWGGQWGGMDFWGKGKGMGMGPWGMGGKGKGWMEMMWNKGMGKGLWNPSWGGMGKGMGKGKQSWGPYGGKGAAPEQQLQQWDPAAAAAASATPDASAQAAAAVQQQQQQWNPAASFGADAYGAQAAAVAAAAAAQQQQAAAVAAAAAAATPQPTVAAGVNYIQELLSQFNNGQPATPLQTAAAGYGGAAWS